MATLAQVQKVECRNPNTGGRMFIDKSTYDLFSEAIYFSLKKDGPLTFTQLVESIYRCFEKQGTSFEGSVEWYAVTVKNNLHARNEIEVYVEKNKKRHALKKQ